MRIVFILDLGSGEFALEEIPSWSIGVILWCFEILVSLFRILDLSSRLLCHILKERIDFVGVLEVLFEFSNLIIERTPSHSAVDYRLVSSHILLVLLRDNESSQPLVVCNVVLPPMTKASKEVRLILLLLSSVHLILVLHSVTILVSEPTILMQQQKACRLIFVPSLGEGCGVTAVLPLRLPKACSVGLVGAREISLQRHITTMILADILY